MTALLAGLVGCSGVVVDSSSDSSSSGGGGAGGSTLPDPAACSQTGWARAFPDGYDYGFGQSVSIDAQCNVIVAGWFGGEMDLGGATVSGPDSAAFLAKFDSDGHPLWGKSFGIEPFNGGGAAAAVAPSGDIVLVGSFTGSIDFGTGAFSSPTTSIFVARFDPSGKPIWSRAYSGTETGGVSGVAVSQTGEIYLAGGFAAFLDFGTGQKGAAGETSSYVVRLSPEGDTEWVTVWSGGLPRVHALAVDSGGSVVVTGAFKGKTQVGQIPLSNDGAFDSALLVKLDPSGAVVYARALTTGLPCIGDGVTIDSDGNALFSGEFDGALDFGSGPVQGTGYRDGYLLSLDAAGQTRWARTISPKPALKPEDRGEVTNVIVAAAPAGGAWLAGEFDKELPLGPVTLTTDDINTGFLAEIDANGDFVSARRFGEVPGIYLPFGLAVDPAGGVLMTGDLEGQADLGTGPFQSTTGSDAFLARVLK